MQVEALPGEVDWDTRAKGKTVLGELLTRHLLALDGIQAGGDRETPPQACFPRLGPCMVTILVPYHTMLYVALGGHDRQFSGD